MKYLSKDFLKNTVDWTVDNAEHVLIRATPILSPLPSAFAIVHALANAGWAQPMLMGGVIEAMGMGAGATIGFITSHNRQNPDRTIDPRFGYGLFGFYVIVAASIIGGYETLPVLFSAQPAASDIIRSIVPLLFPGLTLIGSVIVALQGYMRRTSDDVAHRLARVEAEQDTERQHTDAEFTLSLEMKRREAELRLDQQQAEHAQKLEIERQRAAAKLAATVAQPLQEVAPIAQPRLNAAQRRQSLLQRLVDFETPDQINNTLLGEEYSTSRETIRKDLQWLVDNGRLELNGKVKVLA